MARAREVALDVERSYDPLPELLRALRRRYRKAGIVAVGMGMRRHDRKPGRPLTSEPTLKLVVRKKLDPLPRGRTPLPGWLVLRSRWMGRPFRVRIRTDVEERPRGALTQFELPTPTGSLCTGAYARWTADGRARFGVVTAGHGLWARPSDARPLAGMDVDLGTVCQGQRLRGRVVCASHLRRDGVDVGLVELPAFDPCLYSMWNAVDVPGIPRLFDRLGAFIDDGLSVDATFRHFSLAPRGTRAVALYREYPLTVAGGWGSCRLADVGELEGPPDTFLGGTSGSGLVSKGAGKLALAVQSLCLDRGLLGSGRNRRGLGTAFCRAVSWIRAASGRDVELFWSAPPPP
jgi:hypothetical protein